MPPPMSKFLPAVDQIHPVYAIDVCKKKSLTSCKADNDSVWTPLDLAIFPAASSRMPVGRETKLCVPLHPLMVWLPSCRRAVEAALTD